MQHRQINATDHATTSATIDLKALSLLVLERNNQCNNPCNTIKDRCNTQCNTTDLACVIQTSPGTTDCPDHVTAFLSMVASGGWIDDMEERAAIREYDGALSRQQAQEGAGR